MSLSLLENFFYFIEVFGLLVDRGVAGEGFGCHGQLLHVMVQRVGFAGDCGLDLGQISSPGLRPIVRVQERVKTYSFALLQCQFARQNWSFNLSSFQLLFQFPCCLE